MKSKFPIVLNFALLLTACTIQQSPPIFYRSPNDVAKDGALAEAAMYSGLVKEKLEQLSPQKVMEVVQARMVNELKDPDSAKFRNVRIVTYLNGAVVCGEINAKNSYGGYVGFRRFAGSTYSSSLSSTDTDPAVVEAHDAGIDAACSGVPYVKPFKN